MADEPEVDTPEADAAELTLSPLLEAVQAPISDGNPVGDDVKYEDSFQQLKAEVDKVQSANADADFEQIVALGTQVLGTQSKDLTAAAYLGFGLLQTQGFAGVAEGADAVRILCETYWEDMYPPLRRMVARKNALQLIIDRSHDWLEGQKLAASDVDEVQRALDSYKALQGITTEKMEENAPVLSKITRLLEEKIRTAPKTAAPAPPAESPASPAAPASRPAASAAAPQAAAAPTDPDGFRSRNEAERAIMAAVTYLNAEGKTDPVPFRIARALRWGGLVAAPPAEDGQTMIPPFVEQRKGFLDGLLGGGQFAELIEQSESSFREQPFWLDLQRYIATACEALGAPFAPIRDAVMDAVVGLLRRFPEVPDLRFEDGTPFADTATHEWIEMKVRPAMSAGSDAGPAPSAESDSAVDADFAAARQHLAGGDLDAALAALGETTDAAERDRFRRRLYLATLCVRGGRPAVARALLERLDDEAAARSLGMWEPKLALDVWTALHGCYEALQRGAKADKKTALQEAAEQAFQKIAAFDPVRAVALRSSSKK